MRDRLERRVRLLADLETVTALHVGSGRPSTTVGTDSPVVRDLQNRPFIPGSSFKGVLRSSLEALLRDRPQDGPWACGRMDSEDEGCVTRDDRKAVFDGPGSPDDRMARWVKLVYDKSCTICSLFGSPWLAARVAVADLALKSEWQDSAFTIRDGVAIARDTLTVSGRLKYDFETVPPGTVFRLILTVDNPADWEMGLLLAGLDLFHEGYAVLGGKTSRGLGRVRISLPVVEEKTARDFLCPEEAGPVGGQVPPDRYRRALADLVGGGDRDVPGTA